MVVPGAKWAQPSQDQCSIDGVFYSCQAAQNLHDSPQIHSHFFYYNHQTSTVGNRREKCVQQSSGKRVEHSGREALEMTALGRLDLPARL